MVQSFSKYPFARVFANYRFFSKGSKIEDLWTEFMSDNLLIWPCPSRIGGCVSPRPIQYTMMSTLCAARNIAVDAKLDNWGVNTDAEDQPGRLVPQHAMVAEK